MMPVNPNANFAAVPYALRWLLSLLCRWPELVYFEADLEHENPVCESYSGSSIVLEISSNLRPVQSNGDATAYWIEF